MKDNEKHELEKLSYDIANGTKYWIDVERFIQSLLTQARQEGYEAGIKDELECMEKSGEHHIECQKICREKLEHLENFYKKRLRQYESPMKEEPKEKEIPCAFEEFEREQRKLPERMRSDVAMLVCRCPKCRIEM